MTVYTILVMYTVLKLLQKWSNSLEFPPHVSTSGTFHKTGYCIIFSCNKYSVDLPQGENKFQFVSKFIIYLLPGFISQ